MNPTPTGAQSPSDHVDPVAHDATDTTASAKIGPARSRRSGRRANASMIIGACLVVLIVGLALISFVWTRTTRPRSTPPPVCRAAASPTRSAPTPSDGTR